MEQFHCVGSFCFQLRLLLQNNVFPFLANLVWWNAGFNLMSIECFELNVVLLLTGNRVSFRGGKLNVYYDCRVSFKGGGGGRGKHLLSPPLVKFSK